MRDLLIGSALGVVAGVVAAVSIKLGHDVGTSEVVGVIAVLLVIGIAIF
ncbi:hypothetical protein PUR29_35030 [Methylobacterium ajmalii]|uniref:GlsB/YeaQ/YmgE family stress response membrane protein n=1 Tax=Methylobacterium ajmalii TaxID=2738439 RepID=A0ABV0A4X1_9HYPH